MNCSNIWKTQELNQKYMYTYTYDASRTRNNSFTFHLRFSRAPSTQKNEEEAEIFHSQFLIRVHFPFMKMLFADIYLNFSSFSIFDFALAGVWLCWGLHPAEAASSSVTFSSYSCMERQKTVISVEPSSGSPFSSFVQDGITVIWNSNFLDFIFFI